MEDPYNHRHFERCVKCGSRDCLCTPVKALMDAVAIYGGRINKATAYLHGLSVFSDDVKSAELKEAIEILEGNV